MELKDIMADYIGVRNDDKRYPNKPRNVYKYSIPVNEKYLGILLKILQFILIFLVLYSVMEVSLKEV